MAPEHRGFTLIEVVVALVLGAMVVLGAHAVFAGVTDGLARLEAARTQLDRSANAQRWLIEALGSLQVGADSAGGFEGHSATLSAPTWVRSAAGGFRRVRMTLRQESTALVAELSDGTALTLADSVRTVAFDYLLEPGAQTTWAREWVSPVSAPLAIRIRITRITHTAVPPAGGEAYVSAAAAPVDTVLLLVGPRG
jgi:prepilin-type N-terminal cleavage/methylation domain-containing protein